MTLKSIVKSQPIPLSLFGKTYKIFCIINTQRQHWPHLFMITIATLFDLYLLNFGSMFTWNIQNCDSFHAYQMRCESKNIVILFIVCLYLFGHWIWWLNKRSPDKLITALKDSFFDHFHGKHSPLDNLFSKFRCKVSFEFHLVYYTCLTFCFQIIKIFILLIIQSPWCIQHFLCEDDGWWVAVHFSNENFAQKIDVIKKWLL